MYQEVVTASAKGPRQRESQGPVAEKQGLVAFDKVYKFHSKGDGKPLEESMISNFSWKNLQNLLEYNSEETPDITKWRNCL